MDVYWHFGLFVGLVWFLLQRAVLSCFTLSAFFKLFASAHFALRGLEIGYFEAPRFMSSFHFTSQNLSGQFAGYLVFCFMVNMYTI